jgi:hypothetical protein
MSRFLLALLSLLLPQTAPADTHGNLPSQTEVLDRIAEDVRHFRTERDRRQRTALIEVADVTAVRSQTDTAPCSASGFYRSMRRRRRRGVKPAGQPTLRPDRLAAAAMPPGRGRLARRRTDARESDPGVDQPLSALVDRQAQQPAGLGDPLPVGAAMAVEPADPAARGRRRDRRSSGRAR